jgi:hypothetical protein
MAKYFFVFVIILCLGMGSCSKKEEKAVNCSAWGTEISDELSAVMNTAIAYSTSPTAANCNAYKSAYQAYINAMKTFTDCVATWTPEMKTQYQSSLTEAENAIKTLNCN